MRNRTMAFVAVVALVTLGLAGCGSKSGSEDPTCDDGVQNGDETGVDCGGSCPACGSTCSDGVQNGDETGVDCGGSCPACVVEGDCTDGVRNGDERGIDCGGSCPNQDCCTNGFADWNLGELGVDCHGECAAVCYAGTIYHVSNAGDDANDGLTEQTPWQTIGHVNDQTFSPGDAILFRRGDTWRETLELWSSGTPEAYVTYGAYGDGARPRILGSEQATGWTEVATNVWQSSTTLENPYAGGYSDAEVFFELGGDYLWGRQRDYDAAFSNLVQDRDWCWDSNTLYVYSTSDPGARFGAVEAPQRDGCIRFPSIDGSSVLDEDYVQYVALDNLELMYARRWGIYPGYNEIEASGMVVTNCHIGCIGVRGGSSAYCIAAWQSDTLIQNNIIHDCGRRGVSYNTYTDHTPGLTVQNVTIHGNLFYNGFHTTGPDLSSLPGLGHTFTNITISGNIIDDSARAAGGIHDGCVTASCTSNSIYAQAEDGNDYNHFYIHGNTIIGSTSRAILMRDVDDLFVYHNTVYGNHPDAEPYSLVTFSSCQGVDFRNNLIHGTLPSTVEGRCLLDEGDTTFALHDYNLYYQDDPAQAIIGSENGVGGWYVQMDEWQTWIVDSGFETNAPAPGDPELTDPGSGDFSLPCTSRAVNHGVPLPGFNDGYQGSAPDIGAHESACTD